MSLRSFAADILFITTMSRPARVVWWWRNDSRIIRLRRLRTVAFLHCFFDIAKPSRDVSSSFLRHSTVNHLSRLRVALSNTRPNDAASSNRLSLLNRCGGLRSKSEILLAGKMAAMALNAKGADYGVSFARPFARRRLRTRRPALVAMRARKPCVRARFNLLG